MANDESELPNFTPMRLVGKCVNCDTTWEYHEDRRCAAHRMPTGDKVYNPRGKSGRTAAVFSDGIRVGDKILGYWYKSKTLPTWSDYVTEVVKIGTDSARTAHDAKGIFILDLTSLRNFMFVVQLPRPRAGGSAMTATAKVISDYPGVCPGCKGPAYVGAVPSSIDCKKRCCTQYTMG